MLVVVLGVVLGLSVEMPWQIAEVATAELGQHQASLALALLTLAVVEVVELHKTVTLLVHVGPAAAGVVVTILLALMEPQTQAVVAAVVMQQVSQTLVDILVAQVLLYCLFQQLNTLAQLQAHQPLPQAGQILFCSSTHQVLTQHRV